MLLSIQLNQTDNSGQCSLVHAAVNGQLDAVSVLLQFDWKSYRDRQPERNEALQQALVASASQGHSKVHNMVTNGNQHLFCLF